MSSAPCDSDFGDWNVITVFPSCRDFLSKWPRARHTWATDDLSLWNGFMEIKYPDPLMAVLLPKATITHDCIDMEF